MQNSLRFFLLKNFKNFRKYIIHNKKKISKNYRSTNISLTTVEKKSREKAQKDLLAEKAEAEAKAAAKQVILDRIGLTVDELQTILG